MTSFTCHNFWVCVGSLYFSNFILINANNNFYIIHTHTDLVKEHKLLLEYTFALLQVALGKGVC